LSNNKKERKKDIFLLKAGGDRLSELIIHNYLISWTSDSWSFWVKITETLVLSCRNFGYVFCPFLDWIIYSLGVEFDKFFIDFGY